MKTTIILLSAFAMMANYSFGYSVGCAPTITGGSGTSTVPNVPGSYVVKVTEKGTFTLSPNPDKMNEEKKVKVMDWEAPAYCVSTSNEDIFSIDLTGVKVGGGTLKATQKIDSSYSIDASCGISVNP